MHLCDMLVQTQGGTRAFRGVSEVTNIDLKLLAVVTELHRTKSVSQTAENLDLSQSAISMSLAKLRKLFNDPLFVRTSSGMNPTPHAVELIGLLKNAEDILQAAFDLHVVFDPMVGTPVQHVFLGYRAGHLDATLDATVEEHRSERRHRSAKTF